MITVYLDRVNGIVKCFNESSVVQEVTIITTLQIYATVNMQNVLLKVKYKTE